MEIDLYYSLAGALTGFVVGLTGVGGGALMTPILLIIFDVSVVTAVATDLWFAAITKIATLGIHHKKGQIDWKIAKLLWLGSIPCSFFVVLAVVSGSVSKISGFLPKAIGVLVLITALGLVISNKLKTEKPSFQFRNIPHFKKILPLAIVISGALFGVLTSFTSASLTTVGAGVFGTLVLIYLYSYRTSSHKIVATDTGQAITLELASGTEKQGFKFTNIPNFNTIQPIATILSGAVLGIIVSLTSVGAGVFGTLILIYLYSYRMSSHKIVATDIAHAIPLALVAGTGYLISGKVNFSLLASLLIGSIPMAILGAVVAHKISDRLLKLSLSIVLFFVGLKLVF